MKLSIVYHICINLHFCGFYCSQVPQNRLTWPALLEHPFVKERSDELEARVSFLTSNLGADAEVFHIMSLYGHFVFLYLNRSHLCSRKPLLLLMQLLDLRLLD